jgi:hypothetical protein
MEEGWITFYTAAHLLREQGMGWAEACKLLRAACRDEDITSMAAPDDEPAGVLPIEYWKRIPPSDWKEREVDYDGPDGDGCQVVVMLKEDDVARWQSKLAVPKTKPRASPKNKLAQLALAELNLPANTPDPDAEKQVNDWLKANNYPSISKSTIVRVRRANKLTN